MRSTRAHCPVIEANRGERLVREPIPWADPYVSRLLSQHRLEAALNDSLNFLRTEVTLALPNGHRLDRSRAPWES
jgi:hypothetical protein